VAESARSDLGLEVIGKEILWLENPGMDSDRSEQPVLITSVAGIVAVWIYNEPLTQKVSAQLSDIDSQLAQAEATLKSSEQELARALRIMDSAQSTLES